MRRVGLLPTDTGAQGGKETGQSVTHYIEPEGRFECSCAALIQGGFALPFVELWGDEAGKAKAKKAASKTRYTCPECEANAWAKPGTSLICGACYELDDGRPVMMEAEPVDEQDED